MAAGTAVKKQKEESESIAAALAAGRDPTTIPVPWALKYLQATITLNQSLLAAINGSIAAPDTEVVLGPEHGSSHHAPWGEPGQRATCLEAGRMALRAELANGLHGGREPWGYATMYGVCYSLAAAHPDPECREIGRRLLAGWLAVFYLLRGYQMGCRAGVAPEPNAVAILGMLAGEDAELSDRDWHAAARVFEALMHQIDLPRITSNDEAAAVLRDSEVRCLLGWEWMDYGEGVFGAAIMASSGCIKKGTGSGVLMLYDGHAGRAVDSLPRANRMLSLGPGGLAIHGPWSLADPQLPEPEVEPEEPLEPDRAQPTLADLQQARALLKDVQGKVRQGLTGRQAQGVRQEIQEVRKLLREEKGDAV